VAFTAIDTNISLAVQAAALAGAGIQRVGRYLSYTPSKNLTPPEALALGKVGIGCWLVWETTQGRALAGANAGTADAIEAVKQAAALNAPTGTAIYFAVDSDVTDAQIAGPINDYFTAVKAAIGTDCVPGANGNGAVCAWCLDHNLTQVSWVWAGRLTNGTQAFVASNRWDLHQYPEIAKGSVQDTLKIGIGFDPDDYKDSCRAFLTDEGGTILLGAAAASA
jgi:hypothetical protein